MQFRQLEYFVSLCETLNFTRTAAEFYVSQTAVTQQIKALEEELQTQLFDRTRRSVSVTAAGRLLYEDARLIIRHMREAEMRMKTLSGGALGTLRVGFLRGYEQAGLSAALRTFHEWMPEVSLTFSRGSSAELYRSLRLGNTDVIFAHRICDNRPELDDWTILQYPLMAVFPKGHPLGENAALRPEELAGHRIVLLHHSADDVGAETIINQFFLHAGFMPKVAFQSDDIETNLLAISAGLGYGLIPSYLCDHLTPAMHLETRPIVGYEEEMAIAAIWNRDNPNPLVQRLLDICALELKR